MLVLGVYAYRKISHELYKQRLLEECIVLDIPALNIKTPVMDGIDNDTLSVAAGHFEGTGALGSGNYCIAGHNSTIYAEIFNEIDRIEIGMKVYLYDNNEERTPYEYSVTEYMIVEPEDTWVLGDFNDNRITIVTCTDDGTQRQIIIGELVE